MMPNGLPWAYNQWGNGVCETSVQHTPFRFPLQFSRLLSMLTTNGSGGFASVTILQPSNIGFKAHASDQNGNLYNDPFYYIAVGIIGG